MTGPLNKRNADQVLVLRSSGTREKAVALRRALLEIGRTYECAGCGIDKWKDAPLILEIDHIDWNPLNCVAENLQFLCPNCHSTRKLVKVGIAEA